MPSHGIRTYSESKRRKNEEHKRCFKHLRNVLNWNGEASQIMSYDYLQILMKAIDWIKGEENVTFEHMKMLKKCREQEAELGRQRQTRIDELLSQGVPQSTIDQLLSEAPPPADPSPFKIPKSPARVRHSRPSLSNPLDISAGRRNDDHTQEEGEGQSGGAEWLSADQGLSGDGSTAHSQKSRPGAGLPSLPRFRSEAKRLDAKCDSRKSKTGCGSVSGNDARREQYSVAGEVMRGP